MPCLIFSDQRTSSILLPLFRLTYLPANFHFRTAELRFNNSNHLSTAIQSKPTSSSFSNLTIKNRIHSSIAQPAKHHHTPSHPPLSNPLNKHAPSPLSIIQQQLIQRPKAHQQTITTSNRASTEKRSFAHQQRANLPHHQNNPHHTHKTHLPLRISIRRSQGSLLPLQLPQLPRTSRRPPWGSSKHR